MLRNFRLKIVHISLFFGAVFILLIVSGGGFLPETVNAQRSGATIYSQNCARCHGSDGRAQTPKGRQVDAIDLTSDDWSPDTDRDIRIVTKGKKSMPAFKGKLTPADISAVVEYIRRFKH